MMVLQATGGVEGLEMLMIEQSVELRQVADWLRAMQASSSVITTYVNEMKEWLEKREEEARRRFDSVDTKLDSVDSTLKEVLAYMATTTAIAASTSAQQAAPVFVIPRAAVRFSEDALALAARGAFGTVLKAARDQGHVAVKIYNHRGLGGRDHRRVFEEAVLLARANHQNIVRCFGVVHDPALPNDPRNIHGSLVMVSGWLLLRVDGVDVAAACRAARPVTQSVPVCSACARRLPPFLVLLLCVSQSASQPVMSVEFHMC
jgi:hypothetical protein